MGHSEKLMELKKAFAEIILNTAKEAAARVMVAEKKAFRYRRELAEAKEDAVRMMIRLKQMMDSRIHEADAVAVHQKSKIDELEAQLHEAEDIVKDLREELAIVREELDVMRKKQANRISEQQAYHIVIREQGEEITPSISDYNQVLKGKASEVAIFELGNTEAQKLNEIIRDDQHETVHASDLDTVPIVMLSKEPELLRNGSSKRINELAREDLNNIDDLHRKSLFAKNDSTVQENCESNVKSVTQTSSAEVNVSQRKSISPVKQAKKSNTNSHRIQKSKSPSSYLRKRQSLAKIILKSVKKTNLVTSKTNPSTAVSSAVKEYDSQIDVKVSINTTELCSKDELRGTIQPCGQSTPESDKSNMGKVSTGEENGSTESSVTCIDPEIPCVPSCSIIEESDELDADDASQSKQDKSVKFTFQRKRKKECVDSADGNDIVVVKRSSDEDTLCRPTTVDPNADGPLAGPRQQSGNKENTLQELKRSLKRVKVNIDKQEFKTSMKPEDAEMPTATGPKTIGIVPKATRDSRRLAQVSRQLLSMSEKKWWD